MSLWHSPQAFESMKKFDGMMPPTLVFADDGKNGDFGPPPSSSMEVGTTRGLTMWPGGLGIDWLHIFKTGAMISTAAVIALRNAIQPRPASRRCQTQIQKAINP